LSHESSGGAGLNETLGVDKGSVSLDDLHEADLVLAVGLDPGTNMPRMLSALAKTRRNGGDVIAVNPLRTVPGDQCPSAEGRGRRPEQRAGPRIHRHTHHGFR
jgi:predicted molibdopterin-dependent oxidoreductase YjgC